MAEPYYTDIDTVRSALGLDSSALDDVAAVALIEDAEDLVDRALGSRLIDPVTGRKVVEDAVEAWQWGKVARATVKVARLLHANPDLALQEFEVVKGPDFEFRNRVGSLLGPQVDALLESTGLIATVNEPAAVGVLAVTRDRALRDWSDDQVLLGRCDDPDLPV